MFLFLLSIFFSVFFVVVSTASSHNSSDGVESMLPVTKQVNNNDSNINNSRSNSMHSNSNGDDAGNDSNHHNMNNNHHNHNDINNNNSNNHNNNDDDEYPVMFLEDCRIFLLGFPDREEQLLSRIITSGGGTRFASYNSNVTHVVYNNSNSNNSNGNSNGPQYPSNTQMTEHIQPFINAQASKTVSAKWLRDCHKQKGMLPADVYTVRVPPHLILPANHNNNNNNHNNNNSNTHTYTYTEPTEPYLLQHQQQQLQQQQQHSNHNNNNDQSVGCSLEHMSEEDTVALIEAANQAEQQFSRQNPTTTHQHQQQQQYNHHRQQQQHYHQHQQQQYNNSLNGDHYTSTEIVHENNVDQGGDVVYSPYEGSRIFKGIFMWSMGWTKEEHEQLRQLITANGKDVHK